MRGIDNALTKDTGLMYMMNDLPQNPKPQESEKLTFQGNAPKVPRAGGQKKYEPKPQERKVSKYYNCYTGKPFSQINNSLILERTNGKPVELATHDEHKANGYKFKTYGPLPEEYWLYPEWENISEEIKKEFFGRSKEAISVGYIDKLEYEPDPEFFEPEAKLFQDENAISSQNEQLSLFQNEEHEVMSESLGLSPTPVNYEEEYIRRVYIETGLAWEFSDVELDIVCERLIAQDEARARAGAMPQNRRTAHNHNKSTSHHKSHSFFDFNHHHSENNNDADYDDRLADELYDSYRVEYSDSHGGNAPDTGFTDSWLDSYGDDPADVQADGYYLDSGNAS